MPHVTEGKPRSGRIKQDRAWSAAEILGGVVQHAQHTVRRSDLPYKQEGQFGEKTLPAPGREASRRVASAS